MIFCKCFFQNIEIAYQFRTPEFLESAGKSTSDFSAGSEICTSTDNDNLNPQDHNLKISMPPKYIALLLAGALSIPAHAGLFGPDNVPLAADALREKLQGQPLSLSIKAVPLELKSKGAAVGGFVLGFVLSSAMASGAGPNPGMSAQQNAQFMQTMSKAAADVGGAIATTSARMLDAQASKAAGQQAQEGPMAWLAPQLQAAFDQAYASRWQSAPTDATKLQLDLDQSAWTVDFSMLSSDYELRYALDMTLTDTAVKAINKKATCTGAYAKKMPLDDWKKDDHQAIASASKEVAEQCLDKFLAALNIGRAAIPVPAATASVAQAETGKATSEATTAGEKAAEASAAPASTTGAGQ